MLMVIQGTHRIANLGVYSIDNRRHPKRTWRLEVIKALPIGIFGWQKFANLY